jgi:subtilisin family serine protease
VVLAQPTSTTTSSASPTQEEAAEATNAGDVIPDRYIVVLKEDSTGQQVASARRGGQDPTQVANEQARQHGLKVRDVYRNTIQGYAAEIPEDEIQEVENDPRVAFVEQDQVMKATKKKKKKEKRRRNPAPIAQVLPWGINKIDADVSSTKAGDGTGGVSNVNAYIIDTGISTHGDLNVTNPAALNAVNDGKNYDCNGHGTHVAGTVAAKDDSSDVVGVVPGAPLTGIKVLRCNGSGTTSGVIAGVEWVTANAEKPAIANMSLGGGASDALDQAMKKSAESGIFYAVAAGNDGADACTKSPARAGAGTNNGIMTVAATDSADKEASWSNYGSCVDIWAPGVSILSTKRGGGTTTKSGTSMASPHAGGAGALYLSTNTGASASAIEARLKTDSVATSTKSKNGAVIKRLFAGNY